jgi:acetyl-CoA carboxylase biotin carboxylase subunit
MFDKVLIANRGEIAERIIRGCREMGLKTVAVFSDVDRNALHVQHADEAWHIGPPPALESYLNIDKIIDVAKKSGAQAIHPGYGFLAENHLFARRCADEGIEFIGPPADAMELLGDKIKSRKFLSGHGIPNIPGMMGSTDSVDEIVNEASSIGFPVLVKAAAGGGGKGMRVVEKQEDLKDAVESAMREAKSAFNDPTVYVEKYIVKPRHIEFQVLADKHGNCVHLFERECSIQRRHQKIVEETPSPALDDELRKKMGDTALKIVELAGYYNAGTVEMILDEDGSYYFLEVNARLQVEHPITELITGIDLVHQQLRVAAGEKLTFKQSDLEQRGHAIECRIYAENPETGFTPSPGKIIYLREPQGAGIRVDSGIYPGYTVTPDYDPILSKLIVWAEDRETAAKKMALALEDYVILGIKSTVEFLKDVMSHPEYLAGNTYTDFIKMNYPEWKPEPGDDNINWALIAAGIHSHMEFQNKGNGGTGESRSQYNPWLTVGSWEIMGNQR